MSRSSEVRRARPLLGTLVEIAASGAGAAVAVEAAFREIEAVHRLMSFHEPGSDVSRINRAPVMKPLAIDRRTYHVLAVAKRLGALSHGVFDVAVGATLVENGFLPQPAGAGSVDRDATFHDILLLDEDRIALRRRAWIDLGGIAKGYAVDRAVETLQACGVVSGMVNAGGDLRIFGDPRPVYVRHPRRTTEFFALGDLANVAVASSSGFYTERTQASRIADPLVHPARRRCTRWRKGITVLAPDCITADALTKALRLAPQRAPMLLDRFAAQAFAIDARGMHELRDSSHALPGADVRMREAS